MDFVERYRILLKNMVNIGVSVMDLDDPFYIETCVKCKEKLNIMKNAGTDLEAVPSDVPEGWFHMKCYNEMLGVIERWLNQKKL